MIDESVLSEEGYAAIEEQVKKEIEEAIDYAENQCTPISDLSDILRGVYASDRAVGPFGNGDLGKNPFSVEIIERQTEPVSRLANSLTIYVISNEVRNLAFPEVTNLSLRSR